MHHVCRHILSITALIAIGSTVPANAITLDWDSAIPAFSNEEVNDGDQSISNGISVTFSNIVGADGSDFGNVDSDGIYFSSDSRFSEVVQMSMTFNTNIVWVEYDIDFERANPSSGFVVSGSNGTSGLNLWGNRGRFDFDMGTIPVFLAGETYTLTHNLTGRRFSQIDEIVVSVAPVPLPMGGVLLLGAIGAVVLVLPRLKSA